MAKAYKVYDNNNKLIDVFGKEQLCDYATHQICDNKGAYTEADINKTFVIEPKQIVKIKSIVRKVVQESEYVGTVDQCKLVLKVLHYKVKEVELY